MVEVYPYRLSELVLKIAVLFWLLELPDSIMDIFVVPIRDLLETYELLAAIVLDLP